MGGGVNYDVVYSQLLQKGDKRIRDKTIDLLKQDVNQWPTCRVIIADNNNIGDIDIPHVGDCTYQVLYFSNLPVGECFYAIKVGYKLSDFGWCENIINPDSKYHTDLIPEVEDIMFRYLPQEVDIELKCAKATDVIL